MVEKSKLSSDFVFLFVLLGREPGAHCSGSTQSTTTKTRLVCGAQLEPSWTKNAEAKMSDIYNRAENVIGPLFPVIVRSKYSSGI